MPRAIIALIAVFYTSILFAEEEIYLYASYRDNEGARIAHKMDCRNSVCTIENDTARKEISLTDTQRDQILEAFRSEVQRFEMKSVADSDDRSVKIKFRYSAGGKRLSVSQRVPAGRLSDVSSGLTTVLETHFPALDFSSLGSREPAEDKNKSADPAS